MTAEIDLESVAELLGISMKGSYYLKTSLHCKRCDSSTEQFFLMLKEGQSFRSIPVKQEASKEFQESWYDIPTCSLCRKRMLTWTKDQLIDYIIGVK